MSDNTIMINRAPVLTLWAAVVAERLGFDHQEALSLGKALAGLNAQSKGQRLGIYQPNPKTLHQARERERDKVFYVELCGRAVPAVNTAQGVRATVKSQSVEPEGVERYLTGKFGAALPMVGKAMKELADSREPGELALQAFHLYEQFRPEIPEGVRGWGAAGELKLERIHALAKNR